MHLRICVCKGSHNTYHLQELVEVILQTHYDTVQYETTDNLLSEAEFEALCSSHAACRHHIEIALVRDGKLQIAKRDDDKKVYYITKYSIIIDILFFRYIN